MRAIGVMSSWASDLGPQTSGKTTSSGIARGPRSEARSLRGSVQLSLALTLVPRRRRVARLCRGGLLWPDDGELAVLHLHDERSRRGLVLESGGRVRGAGDYTWPHIDRA